MKMAIKPDPASQDVWQIQAALDVSLSACLDYASPLYCLADVIWRRSVRDNFWLSGGAPWFAPFA